MQDFDVVIVGSGACGGWAGMALAQAGFKTLLLEAGSQIVPYREFHHRWPYEMQFHGMGQPGLLRKHFHGATEYNYRIMIDDRENPYTTPGRQAVRLVALAGPWRQDPALVSRYRPHVRPRVQSRFTRWLRRGLADLLPRNRSVLRPHRKLHRS